MDPGSLQAASDFYRTSGGVRLFRLALAASQRLWPALAVRAACRLFGTPLPPRWLVGSNARRDAKPDRRGEGVLMPGLGHRKILKDGAVLERIALFAR